MLRNMNDLRDILLVVLGFLFLFGERRRRGYLVDGIFGLIDVRELGRDLLRRFCAEHCGRRVVLRRFIGPLEHR